MHSQIQFEEGEAKQRLTQSTSPSPIQASSCSTVCHGQWLHKKPFFFICLRLSVALAFTGSSPL